MRLSILAALGIVVAAGVSCQDHGTGTLAGHVSIGPLQPVVRQGDPEPVPTPAMYAAWRIVVLTADGRREVATAVIGSQGNYQVVLSTGTYTVTAEPVNGGGFGQQSYSVEILDGITTSLDVDIDTGIR